MSARWTVLGVLVVLAGCARTVTTQYTAFLPLEQKPIVREIVIVTDVKPLFDHGAQAIGSIDARGNRRADLRDVVARAAQDAARVGGTHMLIRRAASKRDDRIIHRLLSRDRSNHDWSYKWRYAIDLVERDGKWQGMFFVIRVPPERWNELPSGLRPELVR